MICEIFTHTQQQKHAKSRKAWIKKRFIRSFFFFLNMLNIICRLIVWRIQKTISTNTNINLFASRKKKRHPQPHPHTHTFVNVWWQSANEHFSWESFRHLGALWLWRRSGRRIYTAQRQRKRTIHESTRLLGNVIVQLIVRLACVKKRENNRLVLFPNELNR